MYFPKKLYFTTHLKQNAKQGAKKVMYVIYLNTESESNRYRNNYGYWTGKFYTVQGECYPITVDFKDEVSLGGDKIKVYKSKKIAENSAQKAFEKFGYVVSATVENLEDVPSQPYKKR